MIDDARAAAERAALPGPPACLHLNHSGASLPSAATAAVVAGHLAEESRWGPMEAAERAAGRLAELPSLLATLLKATSTEVAVAPSASAAFGLVWSAFLRARPLRPGEVVLVSRQEWAGNLATYQRDVARAGARVQTIATRDDGRVDLDGLARQLEGPVRWLSLTWFPANGGLVHDAPAIGALARARGVPFLIDAGQALGQTPIDVDLLHCDVLKGAGRKFLRGPRGTAVLYVRRSLLQTLDPPWVDVLSAPWRAGQRDDARVFESAETAVALRLGLAQALRECLALGLAPIEDRVRRLADHARDRLQTLRGVTVTDPTDGARSALVSFTVDGLDAPDVRRRLAAAGISVGANGIDYTPLDMTARGLDGIVRASFHWFNDRAEADRLVEAVAAIAAGHGGEIN